MYANGPPESGETDFNFDKSNINPPIPPTEIKVVIPIEYPLAKIIIKTALALIINPPTSGSIKIKNKGKATATA